MTTTVTPTPSTEHLSRLAVLAREVAAVADAALWEMPADSLDLADALEQFSATATAVVNLID